jgi:secreted PhoX family phosphatase
VSPGDQPERLLPLHVTHSPARSSMTCRYRCGDACSHEAPNTSDNAYFGDVVGGIVSRRGLLKAGAVITVAGAGVVSVAGSAVAEPAGRHHGPRGVNFTPVPANREDRVVVPNGYRQNVVIRWGDPVLPGAPAFDFANQTAAAQAKQFGFNNDFCELAPLSPGRFLMVNNHEYVTEPMLFAGYDPANPTEEQVRISWAAHGMSVVVVEQQRSGELHAVVDRRYNRRITAHSPFTVRGPAAGSALLRTAADPAGTTVLGTLNNCAGSLTPWGTMLSGEENVNQYFANAGQVADPVTRARLARYGFPTGASERKWERFDRRWDLAQEPNEANRFGWIVEIDPYAPDEPPVKHTALGRFKHEGAAVQVAGDGRVVAYMGDDERFDYMYKFVSDERIRRGNGRRDREHNKRLLDSGTLYVAKFTGDSPPAEINGSGTLPSDGEFDGSGEWIPLAHNDTSFVPGFTAAEVYVYARLAADAVGATKMDRPEDVQPNPHNGRIYAALTNNTNRGASPTQPPADEANPRNVNRHGHVLEIEERRGDHTGTRFAWRLLLVCGDPGAPDTYFGGFDKTRVSAISCPDNVAFDSYGNLWISTDGNALGSNDGLFAVPLAGAERGHVKQFLTVPPAAETCGPVVRDRFVLVSVQHPGEGGTIAAPTSHWPEGGANQPRPAVVAVFRPGRFGPGLIGE